MGRNLREHASQTNRQLVVGFLVLVFVVGDGLIYLLFGRQAALMGLICLIAALAPVVLVWLALGFVGWLGNRLDQG